MKSLLIVLLVAAATPAVVSNEVPDVVEVPEGADDDGRADVARSFHPNYVHFMYGHVWFYMREVVDLATISEVQAQTAGSTQRHLNEGISEPPVRMLTGTMIVKQPVPRVFHIYDVYFSFEPSVKIVGIQAFDYIHEGSSATIMSGGLGANNVTIRFQSRRGRGYQYQVYIYGD